MNIHALRALLRLSYGEESKRGRITKFSTMIYTSREGLDYYFVEVTGSNGWLTDRLFMRMI